MNKHIKLLVSVLFIVIIVLAIGITRFYLNVSKDTGSVTDSAEIVTLLSSDGNGNRIFENENSLYGVADSSGHIIVEPQWSKLSFAGDNRCIATKRINGESLTGCIDYEENAVVPFIYSSITTQRISDYTIYIGNVSDDDTFVIYNDSFVPYFNCAWDMLTRDGNEFTLNNGMDEFVYIFSENEFVFKSAIVCGEALGNKYTMDVTSRVMLTKLSFTMLEKISDCIDAYIAYAFTGDFSYITTATENQSQPAYMQFLPESDEFVSAEPVEINNVFVYSTKDTEGDICFNASVTIKLNISYYENESLKTAEREYTAKVRFRYSGTGITMISGRFDSTEFVPDPPEPPADVQTHVDNVPPPQDDAPQ